MGSCFLRFDDDDDEWKDREKLNEKFHRQGALFRKPDVRRRLRDVLFLLLFLSARLSQ